MSNFPPPPVPYAVPGAGTPTSPDLQHLKILAICHWVWGGLTALISCMFIIHIVMGIMMLTGAIPMNNQPANQPFPDKMFGWLFVIIGSLALVIGWTMGLLTVYSGFCLQKQKRRVFSIVIGGINCLSMPVGTVLGIFTIIVLSRASIKPLYDRPQN